MEPIKLEDGIYYVGAMMAKNGLDCNPYLLVDGGEGVLFDPGSKFDFDIVSENVKSLIAIEDIKYVVLHHEDPDFCSAVPLFEAIGLKAEIVTSWRTMTLIQYYDIHNPFYLIENHNLSLSLSSGRLLEFVLTPYLHFAGAFMTYDSMTKSLFSSDLFGAFSHNNTLYADEDYMEKMLTFHEHYMPSNSILRPVMEIVSHMEIARILPQHGSMIIEGIYTYIEALKDLECGSLLTPIKKDFMDSGGFKVLYNDILKRLSLLFDPEEVLAFFKGFSELVLDDHHKIIQYHGSPEAIWESLFSKMLTNDKKDWIIVIEPLVRNLCYQFDVSVPSAMNEMLSSISDDNSQLRLEKQHLENTIHLVNERLIKCPITGLYNSTFFKTLLLEELESEDWRDVGAYVALDFDNFSEYKMLHSSEDVSDAYRALVYLVGEYFGETVLFKMDQSDFGLYIRGYQPTDLIEKLEVLRTSVSKSDAFLSPLTVSMGVAFHNELILDAGNLESVVDSYLELAYDRMRQSKKLGKNRITYIGRHTEERLATHKILIADMDTTNIDIIKVFAKEFNVSVLTCTDGVSALEMAKSELPDLIVTEINLPRLDAYLLREKLLENSKTKLIPMIFMSYQKDEPSVTRALDLGITYYFKKPYMLYELMGIIKHHLEL